MHQQLSYMCRGLRCSAQKFGAAEGPKVMALHGWMDNSNTYAHLAPLLPQLCFVALDLPGHGLSAHRSIDAQYHFVDWVGDVMDAAAALGWEHFSLVGHSMGAAVATLCAACYPTAIDKLLLLDGLGPLSRLAEHGPAHLVQHRTQVARLQMRRPTVYPDLAQMARVLSQVVSGLSIEGASVLLARGAKRTPDGYVSRCDPRLRATSLCALSEPQVMAFLTAIRCPTLLVRPSRGYPFDQKQVQQRCQSFRDLRVAHVEGGHHVHLEDAATVAPHVRAFLGASADGA